MESLNRELPIEDRELIDEFADEYEAARATEVGTSIEDFLERAPRLRTQLLRELLRVELELRAASGEKVTPEDYLKRFSGDQDVVRGVFQSRTWLQSTIDGKLNSDRRFDKKREFDETPKKLGRFRIKKLLGKGGFGVVYLAHDPNLERDVALKVPRRDRFETDDHKEAFIREARTAAQLKHPLIVHVHDVQEIDGSPVIVQEYINGEKMETWNAHHKPPTERLVQVLLKVLEALGYAHKNLLTHCDLKMGNVLIDQDGQPHIVDFGLAVHDSFRLHRKDVRFGTPMMMAPEQVRGEGHRLDGRTDIWAIGVMLYQLLVGQSPFTAKNLDDLFQEICTLDPRPPNQINVEVPHELERICLKCLSKRRNERYRNVKDLSDDLKLWLASSDDAENHAGSNLASDFPSNQLPKIMPKGLRSFDSEDAEFFLELLPGPFDRNGLPETLRFWKSRIETADSAEAFSVGLIYGQSGCGKTSLMKAGLLPRLGTNVSPIYVEATGTGTEQLILRQIEKRELLSTHTASLVDACRKLRQRESAKSKKVLLVIDQFEQWLHAHVELGIEELVDALRQCDGIHLQAILLVRDDFAASVHRLFQELEVPLVEGNNFGLVPLFDRSHARRVLIRFGQAFGSLSKELTTENQEFLETLLDEMCEDSKVSSIRLSLLTEMMKGHDWGVAGLKHIRGTKGLVHSFLQEQFSTKSAPPSHRVHEKAVRQILAALLPRRGVNLKGHTQSQLFLCKKAGYEPDSHQMAEVFRILDSELRIISPVEQVSTDDCDLQSGRHYQLTHDYLVPSVRSWLGPASDQQLASRVGLVSFISMVTAIVILEIVRNYWSEVGSKREPLFLLLAVFLALAVPVLIYFFVRTWAQAFWANERPS